MRIIAHLDMDYFFAQVEERENPILAGQPLVIGADPKDGRGRGVVSTANYEARKFGIHSGMPISWAYRANPKAVYLRPRHNLYQQSSVYIRKVIEKSLQSIPEGKSEQVSIDEFYLDLSSLGTFASANDFCQDLKAKILKNEKLTCSIGLAPNKLLAKIASGFQKPAGLTIVREEEIQSFLDPLPIETLPGVGPKTAQVLKNNGVKTVSDIAKISHHTLTNSFGKWGQNLWEASRGIDNRQIQENRERKTLGSQITFERDTVNFYFLRRTLFDLCQNVWMDCQKEKLSPKMIEVTIRYFDFETHSRQTTLSKPLIDLYQMRQETERLLKTSLKSKPVRLLGVRVGKWGI